MKHCFHFNPRSGLWVYRRGAAMLREQGGELFREPLGAIAGWFGPGELTEIGLEFLPEHARRALAGLATLVALPNDSLYTLGNKARQAGAIMLAYNGPGPTLNVIRLPCRPYLRYGLR